MGHSPSFSQPHQQSGSVGFLTATTRNTGIRARRTTTRVPPPPGRAMPTTTSPRSIPTRVPRVPPPAPAMPTATSASEYPHAGAAGAAAGAGYANNHNGTWNGNNYAGWGATGLGAGYASGVGAWGVGSPMYGWGYSGYSNPYSGGGFGSGGVAQRRGRAAADRGAGFRLLPADQHDRRPARAVRRQPGGFGVRPGPRRRSRRVTTPRPSSSTSRHSPRRPMTRTMHEFLALAYFAQGKYQQAAAPLYAVLSVRPGWDWTTLSGMYPDVDTYTAQLRALEAYVRSNPDSAQAHFVLAYQYLSQGHDPEAIAQLKEVVKLQPGDTLSAQIIAGVPALRRQRSRRPPRRPRPRRRPSRESWPGHGPPRRPRTRRSPWRSRTTARSPGPPPARASRR